MLIKELYQVLDANYEQAFQNYNNEELVKNAILHFKESNPFKEIMEAYYGQDVVCLFEATHSLKEVVELMAFNKIAEISANLCEVIRYKNTFDDEQISPLMQELVREYNRTIEYLNELE
ncbi:MAG: hypothetical protein J5666_02180 [Bacilli bacterium]|nr:hypothetical protein [Bacilli bacterium]